MPTFLCIIRIILSIILSLLPDEGQSETLPSTPKIWLSEYGYIHHQTAEIAQEVALPADNLFRTADHYENNFVLKNGPNYVALENTTAVAFTCEANQPVFWEYSQKLHDVVAPYWTILTADFRSSDKHPNATSFKSVIVIFIDADSESEVTPGSLHEYLFPAYFKLNLTCFTADNPSSHHRSTNSITLTMGNGHPNPLVNPVINIPDLGKLTPAEKIVVAITTKAPDDGIFDKENRTKLYLDNNLFYHANFFADESHIFLGTNATYDPKHVQEIGDDGQSHVVYPGNPGSHDKLVEYHKEENIWEGDTIQIFCFSLNLFYPFGTFVQIHWSNGSVTRVPEVNVDQQGIEMYLNKEGIDNHPLFGGGYLEVLLMSRLRIILTEPFEVKMEMKEVECLMPLWREGDGEWETVKRELNVHPKVM